MLKRLPRNARPYQGADALAAKVASRIEWMRKRGIGIGLKETERPRLTKKPPLPGTVIPFSGS